MTIGERLAAFWAAFTTDTGFLLSILISVISMTLLYFFIFRFLTKNNSGRMIILFAFILIIAGLVIVFNENVSNAVFITVPAVLVFIVITLYSVEIKRIIWAKGRTKLHDIKNGDDFMDEEKIDECIASIIRALQDMSKNDVGAIIVLSNENVPSQILDSGVTLDSDISSELIESVFFPKTPLHDGAMIISGTKIVAAGCFLPLSQNITGIPKDLGTRHRAGIGVTETIDVVSIIVSEETGVISVSKAGKIERYIDADGLKKVLERYYWQETESKR